MAVFNVPRAGRNIDGYMEKLILNMYQDTNSIFKRGYGLNCFSPEMILYSFNAVRAVYCKSNSVKLHYMEFFIEKEEWQEVVINFADWFGSFLFANGFQSYISLSYINDMYVVAVVANSVSYINGRVFYDNNACYAELLKIVSEKMPKEWNLSYTDNTFFNPENPEGNYRHGLYA